MEQEGLVFMEGSGASWKVQAGGGRAGPVVPRAV